MIVAGIDPGNRFVGIAVLDCRLESVARLHLGVVQGETAPRKTKKNPKPPPARCEWLRNREVAATALSVVFGAARDFGGPVGLAIIGIEGAAFSKFGRQDTLAACRQAVFDLLVERNHNPEAVAKMLRQVGSMQAKRALTGYSKADKQRMVEAAGPYIKRLDANAYVTWTRFGSQEQEATADALGIALFARTLQDDES